MLRSRESVSTCALLFVGLFASCADVDGVADVDDVDDVGVDVGDVDDEAADPAIGETARGGHGVFALTTEGFVRGTRTATTREFRGIPYAAAPVGDLRWRPPQRPARRAGILDATQFRDHCPQVGGPFGEASTTEDCLFLNVSTPRDLAFRLRPVMVWIHGGGLTAGQSDVYNPTPLVDQGDVIVVTINYRLGALGFTAHPALTAESPDQASGNYGLLDQQEALRWVRRNIVLFGGDPSRVTIFGESAGGLSVHAQLAAPSSGPLFQRAIVQSGAYQLSQPSLAAGEAAGTAFASRAGCTAQSAACLRGLSVDQVLANQADTTPVVDGTFLPRSIGDAFASGEFNRVPVMEGANRDEWRLFVAIDTLTSGPTSAADYPAAIAATLGVPAQVVPLIVAQYPLSAYPSPDLALSAVGTDAIFACPARFTVQRLSQFVPTFAFEFADRDAPQRLLPPVAFPYGAAHGSEIQYLFDLPELFPGPEFTAAQRDLSEAMISYWTTFARTGQPSSFRTPFWSRYRADRDRFQSLVTPRPRPTAGFAADHRCAFWDALL